MPSYANLPPIIRCMRPHQWVKNVVVLAAFVFAMGDSTLNVGLPEFMLAVVGAGLFSLLSSSIYIINDLRDVELDRIHPTKRFRPIASGDVPPSSAKRLSVCLMLASLGLGFFLSREFGLVLLIYYFMQIAYTLKLKTIALLDVTIIALGFVLRALSGAYLIGVPISPWLLVCTLLLAMMLGLSKRRHEKVVLAGLEDSSRPSLSQTSGRVLDLLIWLVSLATVVAYIAYTLSPTTIEKFGTDKLVYSAPFVVAGLARYLHLVYAQDKGERPERILLTDHPLIAILACYGLTVLGIFLSA